MKGIKELARGNKCSPRRVSDRDRERLGKKK